MIRFMRALLSYCESVTCTCFVMSCTCLVVEKKDTLAYYSPSQPRFKSWSLLQVRCFKVVGSLLSNQNAGMSKTQPEYLFHTNAVIPRKASQQAHARLVTTLDLYHSGINTASCQIST